MRLHRFYVEEPIGIKTEVVVRSASLAHQIKNVFRLRKGDLVVLFDGSGSDYQCELLESDGKSVTLRVVSAGRSRYMPSRRVYLYAALVKKDNFETIAEKATELGVTDIVPLLAEHSEKKSVNEARLRRIILEAAEQSGRGDVPVVHPVTDLKESMFYFGKARTPKVKQIDPEYAVAFHIEGELFEQKKFSNDEDIAIFIGPEGGWSPDEIDMFHKNDIEVRSLGAQVLRAETAVVAALSQVVFS